VIRRDEDVRAIEQAFRAQFVLDPPNARVDQRERFQRQLGADAVGVRGTVRVVQPHERDVGMDLAEPQLEIGVDGVLVLRVVRRGMRGHRAEHHRGTRAK